MSKLIKIDTDYAEWIKGLSLRFRQSQIKAAVKVNSELIQFYWELGRDIVEMQAGNRYGDNLINSISEDLQTLLPGVRGLSRINLYYCKRFYMLYSKVPQLVEQYDQSEKVPQLVEQLKMIPWGHHRYIIDKCSDNLDKALFFITNVVKNNWSRGVLLNFLDTNLYERQGKAVTNFKTTLPAVDSDLAQQLTKDPYCFDFTGLTEPFKERELKEALLHNITKFLLELGNGFAYMGKEYRLQVGDTEQFLDLLFSNAELRAYVVVEVKTTSFEPGHLGQLSAYLRILDNEVKKPFENPSIGIVLCKSANKPFVEFLIQGYENPMGVATYKTKDEIRQLLPSEEQLQRLLSQDE